MMGIALHYTVFILTANLFVLSTCLDIHHPEYERAASTHGYLQNVQPAQQYQYGHQQPNGMYYQGQALDESFHETDYHRGMAQQNYGHVVRRSSPQVTFRQTPCPLRRQNSYRCYRSIPVPANYPLYPFCNVHNYPTANNDEEAESNPIRGRDSRGAMEPSETQGSDDVAEGPSMMLPIYPTIDFEDTKSKRAAQQPPTFYDRLNRKTNLTAIKSRVSSGLEFAEGQLQQIPSEPKFVIPSKFYVNPNIKSKMSQAHDTAIDHATKDYSKYAGGMFGKFSNTNMMGNGRSSESNGGKIYTTDYPEYPKFTGPQRPSESLSAISSVPAVITGQRSAPSVQQQFSNFRAKIDNNSHNPYEYLRGRSGDSSPLASLPTSIGTSKIYPIFTPNMERNDSMKYPQMRTSQ